MVGVGKIKIVEGGFLFDRNLYCWFFFLRYKIRVIIIYWSFFLFVDFFGRVSIEIFRCF